MTRNEALELKEMTPVWVNNGYGPYTPAYFLRVHPTNKHKVICRIETKRGVKELMRVAAFVKLRTVAV